MQFIAIFEFIEFGHHTHFPELQIQAADRLVKEALKNVPEEGSTEQLRQKLKVFYNPQVYVKTEIKGILQSSS